MFFRRSLFIDHSYWDIKGRDYGLVIVRDKAKFEK